MILICFHVRSLLVPITKFNVASCAETASPLRLSQSPTSALPPQKALRAVVRETYLPLPKKRALSLVASIFPIPAKMPSALDVVTSGLATHDVVVILFYRGAWCAICKAWLNKYTNIPAYGELRGIARVLSVAISSEAEADAGAAQASFGLDGVEDLVFVNDSENEVAKLLNDKLVRCFIRILSAVYIPNVFLTSCSLVSQSVY